MIKAIAFTALLSTAAFSQDVLATNMTQSEAGLDNIQKGFLYNSIEMIKKGAEQVKKANDLFHNQEETKKYLPKEKAHMSNIAYNASKRIDTYVSEMMMYLDANEMNKAQNAYSGILGACGSCHAVVRGW